MIRWTMRQEVHVVDLKGNTAAVCLLISHRLISLAEEVFMALLTCLIWSFIVTWHRPERLTIRLMFGPVENVRDVREVS